MSLNILCKRDTHKNKLIGKEWSKKQCLRAAIFISYTYIHFNLEWYLYRELPKYNINVKVINNHEIKIVSQTVTLFEYYICTVLSSRMQVVTGIWLYYVWQGQISTPFCQAGQHICFTFLPGIATETRFSVNQGSRGKPWLGLNCGHGKP